MASIEFDLSEFKTFFQNLNRTTNFKQDAATYMEDAGNKFLRAVQDEIIRVNAIDTGRLLSSFEKNAGDNVWVVKDGGLTLEIGSSVEYAHFVNSGHSTTPPGVAQRWVPGHWNGNKFTYDPNATTGMLLKCKWVEGRHFFDNALRIFETAFNREAEEWLRNYFNV